MKTLAIVGAGKVGQVFGRCFQQQNVFSVTQILNRTSASAQAARTFIGAGAALANWQELIAADVWMLAVGDDHISDVCTALCERGLINEHTIVFHCSGSKASTELAAAAASGAAVASVHPVRSFADPQAVAEHFPEPYAVSKAIAGRLLCCCRRCRPSVRRRLRSALNQNCCITQVLCLPAIIW
jgi:predicted short-subunit dehydrogenase-like oxidoreductase (DUF2520 family)